jgi:membrane-bound lytic murein transglycosylase D
MAALLLEGCEPSSPKQKNVATPPPAAMAPAIPVPTSLPAPQPAAQAPVQKTDPVETIVQQAEREYQSGLNNYKTGHLEAAKADFDRAMASLMQGPVDIRSDERLQREFDRIVEGTNRLEMQALKEGDGFAEQKAEPAPIDEANDITFPADPGVKAQAERELSKTASDLPLMINDYVAGYINFFTNTTKGRTTVTNAWKRAGRYQDMIRRVMKEEGVPQDLMYLAQAESGFINYAVSRVGARGMWQFMHYTAPGYGLKRSWWVDDRQDPEKATRAAALYLKDLYNQFGDWYLAMAAYNSGAGNVQRGVQRTGYADFWELYKRNVLPQETKNYVPIIVAMTIVAKNAGQYGFSDVDIDPPLVPDVVEVDYPLDLRLAAEAIDVPVETLSDLNPSLLRLTTPKDDVFRLKLPAGSAERFQSAIAAIPKDKRVVWRYHRVVAGDTLAELARKYHTTAKSIAEVNNLEDTELAADTKLVIPVTASKSQAVAYSKHPTRYKVRKGDTVLTVADDFAVPADKLRRWNKLKGNALRPGRILVVYKPVSGNPAAEPAAPAKRHKTTKKTKGNAKSAGDTPKKPGKKQAASGTPPGGH